MSLHYPTASNPKVILPMTGSVRAVYRTMTARRCKAHLQSLHGQVRWASGPTATIPRTAETYLEMIHKVMHKIMRNISCVPYGAVWPYTGSCSPARSGDFAVFMNTSPFTLSANTRYSSLAPRTTYCCRSAME